MENKQDVIRYSLLLKMSLVVVVVWALSGLLIYNVVPEWGDRGTVGDMFGAVNALFSGLAFAGLIFTMLLQREDIKMNRAEIAMNRKEMSKSADAQKQSKEALKEQVKQTHLTAKINAISTIVNYYNIQIDNPKNDPEIIEKAREKRRNMIQEIDRLIGGMHNSEVE